jgi:uncharacterized repeat protein (TIGR03843 family)
MSQPTGPTADEVAALLQRGTLTVEGRVVAASNLTLFARVDEPGGWTSPCVYKPVSGERPLWDFPDGTLAARERAAYVISQAGGWDLIPPTVLRDGPLGPGMCQQWVVSTEPRAWIDVLDATVALPPGWVPVLQAQDEHGRPVTLAHRDDEQLRSLAVLDAVLNNADRKGGHLLTAGDRDLLAVDHGLCCHTDPKLRTVLWGWRGQQLRPGDLEQLDHLSTWLANDADELRTLVTAAEHAELRARVRRLLSSGRMPEPHPDWPAIPWPAF